MSYVTAKARGKPAGMSAAVVVNGSIIAAIMLSPMVVTQIQREAPPKVFPVTPETPPPIEPEVEEVKEQPALDPVYTPPTPFDHTPPDNPVTTTEKEVDTFQPTFDGKGEEKGLVKGPVEKIVKEVFTPPPIFKAAMRDRRFLGNFQPKYPPRLLTKEIEGSAKVRVLIGTNGRVRQANIVSATHPGFGKATVKHALKKWRFKPATRDGVAVEDWKTLTVQFNIT